MKLASVILAGGAMHRATGDLPRMLLPFRGIPLLSYSLKLAEELKPSSITIVAGEGYAKIKEWVGGRAAVIEQREQLGSGQAVGLALNHLGDAGDDILVTYGDRIFLKKETLLRLFEAGQAFNAALLSVKLDQPAGYARILRDDKGEVVRASGDCDLYHPQEAKIQEVVAGAYYFKKQALLGALLPAATLDRKYNLVESLAALAQTGRVLAMPIDFQEALGTYSLEDAQRAEAA